MKSRSSAVRFPAVSRSRPYMRPTKFKYSAPVSRPNKAMPSGTTPIWRFTSIAFTARSRPRTSMRPVVGASRPVSILMVVDFPAPLGPRNPKNWPGATRRFTSCTATKSPKRRGRCSVEIAGAAIVADVLIEFQTLAYSQCRDDHLAGVDGSRRQCGCLRKNRENRRQFQAERAAALGPVESGNPPAMLFHDSVADAEAESGALADFLRGVEGVEHFFRFFHARSGVREFDDDVAAFAQRADEQDAAAGRFHGIHRVADQVVENLQQLIRIAAHGGEDAAIFQLDADIFSAQIKTAKLHHAGENAIAVQQLFFGGDLPRKAEQIVDEILGAASLLADFIAQSIGASVGRVFDGQHVGITKNRRKRIIDFVRGPRGELAERGQFLGLHEMGLQTLDVFQRLP